MPSASELRDDLQTTLGDVYDIERELTGGGMSRLFLATERALRRPVVIKLLPRELTSEASTARFRREIGLAAQLRHPHILPVHTAGVANGLLYYVMPYVSGESLRARLARDGALPIAEALGILRDVADALAHAHLAGVVHRDVKPENILIEQGHAVLTDFGVARALSGGAGADVVTGAGVSVGTPGYMAPEQAAGESDIDARADVYALAVVGYEMFAGAPPFTGANAQAVLAAHLLDPPRPLAERRHDVPGVVARAIHRALEKRAADRFRTAAEFRVALDGVEHTSGENATAGSLGAVASGARRLLRFLRPAPEPPAPPRPVSRRTLAVLPFSVRGTDRLAYLGEGMVDLLSAKLDGAGDLCVADARAVLAIVAQSGRAAARAHGGTRELDPGRARAVAERLGAGLYVLGSLLEVGGRLQLSASLYDAAGVQLAAASTRAGEEAQLFDLVDELAIQLLAGHRGMREAHVTHLATAATHSLGALRAYLEGETHFRAGQYSLARESFQRAVDADPPFALAWYRLSLAAEWAGRRDLQDEAAEQAVRHSERLSEHDRQLLRAFVAWRRGDASAEVQYREIVRTWPNDVEAWFQLGEVLFHDGPPRGHPITESREAWERVLAFEPEHLGALHHLARIEAVQGRRTELDTLTRRVLALSPEGERALEMRALRAWTLDDVAEQARVAEELTRSTDVTLVITVRTVATHSGVVGDLEGARALARLATDAHRTPEMRAVGHLQLAYLELARGRWSAARAALEAAAELDEASALEARGLMATLPFLPRDDDETTRLREALERWDAAATPSRGGAHAYLRIHDGVHAHLRAYLLGLLSARAGDGDAALRSAAEVEALGAAGTRVQRALAVALAGGVRAEVAAAGGAGGADDARPAALAILERSAVEIPYDPPLASPFYSRARERWMRASLLDALHRDDDACRWYASFAGHSVYDLLFLAPSHLRRAELHERRGEAVRATEHYERFAELWRDCDPELRALVSDAQERSTRLRAGSGRG
ncbi:MAG: protein kinase [Gemmatimonadaceae bacterium]